MTPSWLAVVLDVAIIVVAVRVAGAAAGRIGQPRVIAEIITGVALGPTLLGALPGDPSAALFPEAARSALEAIGRLGLVLFMFLVGLDFNARSIPRGRVVALTGAGSALVPFVAGLVIAPLLFSAHPPPAGTGLVPFALFVGVALSITAFPVLARILIERGIDRSPLGALTMAAAAFNDVLGWCLLAVVLAIVAAASPWSGPLAVVGTAALGLGLLRVGRPLLARALHRGGATIPAALAIGGTLACAAITEQLGTHVIFGAFLFGVAWPRDDAGRPLTAVSATLRPVTATLLLPVFFAIPGLSMNLRTSTSAGSARSAWCSVPPSGRRSSGRPPDRGSAAYGSSRRSRSPPS